MGIIELWTTNWGDCCDTSESSSRNQNVFMLSLCQWFNYFYSSCSVATQTVPKFISIEWHRRSWNLLFTLYLPTHPLWESQGRSLRLSIISTAENSIDLFGWMAEPPGPVISQSILLATMDQLTEIQPNGQVMGKGWVRSIDLFEMNNWNNDEPAVAHKGNFFSPFSFLFNLWRDNKAIY